MEKFGTLEFVLDRYSGTWCWKISGNRAVNMVSKLIPRGWYGDKPDEVIVSDNDENIKKLKMIDERYTFELLSKSVWKRKIAPLTIKKTKIPKIEPNTTQSRKTLKKQGAKRLPSRRKLAS